MSDIPTILEVNPNAVVLNVAMGGGFVDTIATVANFASLGPATTAGQLKRTADTGTVYIANGTTWVVLSGVPPLIGQQFAALMESPVGVESWARITQDMILAAFTDSLALTGASVVEVGQTVATPAFTASYNRTAAAAVLTDDQGTASQNVISTPTSFASTGTFTKNTYGPVANFTLTANETGGPSKTASASITWLQKIFWDVAVPGVYNAAFIQALTNSALASSRASSFSVTAGATQKIYYAFRSAYGTPTFTVGGFAGGFSLVASAVAVTNGHGFTEAFDLWASDNVNLGATTVVVS